MKTCVTCKQSYDLVNFWKDASKSDGLCRECKSCKHDANEKYRKANPKKHSERGLRWQKENWQKHLEYQRSYRKEKPEQLRAARQRYAKKYPDRLKASWRSTKLKSKFGLTLEEYNNMLSAQDYRCKICSTKNPGKRKSFSIDHCHNSGKIRGLLCSNCNLGLGNFKDDPMIFFSAMKYLGVIKEQAGRKNV